MLTGLVLAENDVRISGRLHGPHLQLRPMLVDDKLRFGLTDTSSTEIASVKILLELLSSCYKV